MERDNRQLLERIREIYFESKIKYSANKVQHQLIKERFSVNFKRVQWLIKLAKLVSIIQKKYTPDKPPKELVLDVIILYSTISINYNECQILLIFTFKKKVGTT